MNPFLRSAVIAVSIGLLMLCVFALHLGCSPMDPLGERFGDPVSIVHEFGRREQLRELHLASHHRRDDKRQAVREMIDQRKPLVEVIAEFQALDREWSLGSTSSEEVSASEPELARIYQRIILFVAEILRDQPEEADAVVRRLEKEYQQLRADRPTSR